MARDRRTRPSSEIPPRIPESPPFEVPIPPGNPPLGMPQPETTGRYIVVYRDAVADNPEAAMRSLESIGIKASDVVSASDYDSAAVPAEQVQTSDATYFPALGMAVVSADSMQAESLAASAADDSSNILAIEPEYIFYAIGGPTGFAVEYLRGFRDAVNHLYEQCVAPEEEQALGIEAATSFDDTPQLTWGLQAVRAHLSRFTGQGVRVAVLDTGFDFSHPDFVGRHVVHQSFIPGQTTQDGQGHGTHCVGTACGPKQPATGVRRYGVASLASIYVGKVLSDSGSSAGGSVLSGMNWAVTNRCQVISLSLGALVDAVSTAFETAGQRALNAGCLMIAAAGNNARRSAGQFGFVEQPANSRSILAVGALDSQLRIADFSARSSTATGVGGKVDIAAPGVRIFSSVPVNRGTHASFNGTSMATPHVAGLAALLCQATGRTGSALFNTVLQTARAIAGDSRDIGVGISQAP